MIEQRREQKNFPRKSQEKNAPNFQHDKGPRERIIPKFISLPYLIPSNLE
jgi:hypothetical protein